MSKILDEFLETGQKISDRLDEMIKEEYKFSEQYKRQLEVMSWEFLKQQENLKEIKEMFEEEDGLSRNTR